MNLVNKSTEYLSGVKKGKDVSSVKSDISECKDTNKIQKNDNMSKAFWCNIYNARIQELIKQYGYNLGSTVDRIKLLYMNRLEVFSRKLSLQRVEHEVLRNGKISFGLGYLPNPRTYMSSIPESPSEVDYRVHFLLNCGALSCPLVRSIQSESFNRTANTAAEQYISKRTIVNKSVVRVPRIFLWYIADFGGIGGIKSTVEKHTNINFSDRKLRFKQYKWQNSNNPYHEKSS